MAGKALDIYADADLITARRELMEWVTKTEKEEWGGNDVGGTRLLFGAEGLWACLWERDRSFGLSLTPYSERRQRDWEDLEAELAHARQESPWAEPWVTDESAPTPILSVEARSLKFTRGQVARIKVVLAYEEPVGARIVNGLLVEMARCWPEVQGQLVKLGGQLPVVTTLRSLKATTTAATVKRPKVKAVSSEEETPKDGSAPDSDLLAKIPEGKPREFVRLWNAGTDSKTIAEKSDMTDAKAAMTYASRLRKFFGEEAVKRRRKDGHFDLFHLSK